MLNYLALSLTQKKKVHAEALRLKKIGLGQRKVSRKLREKYGADVSEATVSNWLYRKVIPGANERTRFKPKPIPPKKDVYKYYVKEKLSSCEIAKKYDVTSVTVEKWVRHYKLPLRTHRESMNTPRIKEILREKKLIKPGGGYEKLDENKAYVLGVLCGDGHISQKTIRFEIRRDEEFIKEFARCLRKIYELPCRYRYYRKRNSFVAYFSYEIVCRDLLSYGKFGCYRWRVPSEILNNRRLRLSAAFLRGFFDSEGSVGSYQVNAVSVNQRGLKDIRKLLAKLGIESRVYSIRNKAYFIIRISHRRNLRLFEKHVGFTAQRKQAKLEQMVRNIKWQ